MLLHPSTAINDCCLSSFWWTNDLMQRLFVHAHTLLTSHYSTVRGQIMDTGYILTYVQKYRLEQCSHIKILSLIVSLQTSKSAMFGNRKPLLVTHSSSQNVSYSELSCTNAIGQQHITWNANSINYYTGQAIVTYNSWFSSLTPDSNDKQMLCMPMLCYWKCRKVLICNHENGWSLDGQI